MPESALDYEIALVADPSVNFEALLHKLDKDFSAAPASLVDRFQFTYDGLVFDVRRVAHNKGHRFLFNATLGYLPFSIESCERRETIKTIIMASRSLPTVHFVADHASKITAGALFDSTKVISPDFIFYPLVMFLQEARPFIKLIGQYLQAPHSAPANSNT